MCIQVFFKKNQNVTYNSKKLGSTHMSNYKSMVKSLRKTSSEQILMQPLKMMARKYTHKSQVYE